MAKQLRYIEISRRNMVSKIFVGSGPTNCNSGNIPCSNFKINIRRTGSDKCAPKMRYNACCKPEPIPLCDLNVATVEALEIDANGYAVFEWPAYLLNFKEGWYDGVVVNDCDVCGVLPLRIGPRCNVLEVETTIIGPDSLCDVGCDDGCADEICPPKKSGGHTKTVYIPD